MSVFTVDLANQPGELARLCEAMAGRGINLVLSAIAREDGGTVAFIADDEAGAQEVLDGAGLQYAMRPALTIRMENQPGTGAATFRKLANAGVNADLLLPVRVSDALFFAVICVDDQDQARQALGAQVIPPGSRPVALAAVPGPGPGRSPPLPRSQRHRSYPRDQTTRPAVIPAPGQPPDRPATTSAGISPIQAGASQLPQPAWHHVATGSPESGCQPAVPNRRDGLSALITLTTTARRARSSSDGFLSATRVSAARRAS
jgi:hypothetical protein